MRVVQVTRVVRHSIHLDLCFFAIPRLRGPHTSTRARSTPARALTTTQTRMHSMRTAAHGAVGATSPRGAKSAARRGQPPSVRSNASSRIAFERVGAPFVASSSSRAPRMMTIARDGAGDDAPPRAQPNLNQMLVLVPPHPLLNHWLAVARNVQTPPAIFRASMAEIGRILIYEAGRDWLQTFDAQVQGPLGLANVTVVNPEKPIAVVPILRAGLTLLEESGSVLPAQQTYHLGYVRDEETLQPKLYLNKLPAKFAEDAQVLISDPMLATGGTIVAAVEEIISRGAQAKNIRIICVVACPVSLTALSERFPGLRVYAAMIDEELNEQGYIVPGLGDAGDRAFGTA